MPPPALRCNSRIVRILVRIILLAFQAALALLPELLARRTLPNALSTTRVAALSLHGHCLRLRVCLSLGHTILIRLPTPLHAETSLTLDAASAPASCRC